MHIFYTKGKFGKRINKTVDIDNEYLYSLGHYPTKIKKRRFTRILYKVYK